MSKKARGFGQSQIPTRDAKRLMLAFRECAAKAKGNQAPIHQFLQSNLDKLNESLLEALPLVFAALTTAQSSTERRVIAALFIAFGNAICQFPLGDRHLNLELSIVTYHLALKVFTREAFPEKWAGTQNNLGNAYGARIRGEQIDNLERAIATYGQAAQVFTREAFPRRWAENQGHLAEALMKRASLTENVSDLDTAVTLLQEALEVAVPGSPDFIDSQHRLGNALSRRYDHSQNPSDLQQALEAYKTALDAINPDQYDRKQIWQALPATQSILGSRLVREGKWQEGLQLLLNSVRQLSSGDDPLAHANALFQTGRAHETLTDWDNARLYYRDALRLYDHLNNPSGIARSRAGLGSVLVSQGYLDKGMAELAKARESYQQLQQPDKAAEIDQLYQVAQRALERQAVEVYV